MPAIRRKVGTPGLLTVYRAPHGDYVHTAPHARQMRAVRAHMRKAVADGEARLVATGLLCLVDEPDADQLQVHRLDRAHPGRPVRIPALPVAWIAQLAEDHDVIVGTTCDAEDALRGVPMTAKEWHRVPVGQGPVDCEVVDLCARL